MQLLAVNYHYFRDIKPASGIYPLTFNEFEKQLDELAKYYTFISQNDLIEKIKTKTYDNKKYCLLTFDDGLKEQMGALEILNKKGIPGVFYVTTHAIRNQKVVNVHKLHFIRTQMKDKEIFNFLQNYIDFSSVVYPLNINELYRYDTLETKKLKYLLNFSLKPELKDKIIDDLFSMLVDEKSFSKNLYMDIEDIQKLDKIKYLGTHSDLHIPLASLNKEQIQKDIFDSIKFLENSCKCKKIRSISYPYGGPKAVSQKVSEVSQSFGFEFGLTMTRGINQIDNFDNPLLLKRIDTNDAPGGKMKSKEFC